MRRKYFLLHMNLRSPDGHIPQKIERGPQGILAHTPAKEQNWNEDIRPQTKSAFSCPKWTRPTDRSGKQMKAPEPETTSTVSASWRLFMMNSCRIKAARVISAFDERLQVAAHTLAPIPVVIIRKLTPGIVSTIKALSSEAQATTLHDGTFCIRRAEYLDDDELTIDLAPESATGSPRASIGTLSRLFVRLTKRKSRITRSSQSRPSGILEPPIVAAIPRSTVASKWPSPRWIRNRKRIQEQR